MEINKIIRGNALEVLKSFPSESIDMQVCSPPYYALRDYGNSTESIWGGYMDCEHEWNINERYVHRGSANNTVHGAILKGGLEVDWKTKDGFCSKCGAWKGQLGLEPDFNLYISHLCDIFDEVKRVLKKEGSCWVNISDSYSGNMGKKNGWTDNNLGFSKEGAIESGVCLTNKNKFSFSLPQKCLVGIPFRFALEMINRGWILRNNVIWHKSNCMPSSAMDRFTIDFEYFFFFTKNKNYYFETQYEPLARSSLKDNRLDKKPSKGIGKTEQGNYAMQRCGAINSNGRIKRAVWNVNPKGFKEAHFAVYPEKLIETPIKACCPEGGIVLDCFFGAGTTGVVTLKQNKKFVGIELNESYIKIAENRIKPYLEQEKLK